MLVSWRSSGLPTSLTPGKLEFPDGAITVRKNKNTVRKIKN
jgi:hypothetical protein